MVITKRDLVDADWLAMLDEELATAFAGTFLADAPRLAVSAKTGEGLPALVAVIEAALTGLPPRPGAGLLRVPIDRVFTLRASAPSSPARSPAARSRSATRSRCIRAGWRPGCAGCTSTASVERATAGQRAAINLPGLAVEELARGDVVGHAGALAPSHLLDVRLRHVAAATAPLPTRSKVLVHHGTAQVQATLVIAGPPVPPGGEAVAQLRVDRATPLAALPGDRFLLRGFTPLANHGTTLGGGEIVRVHAPKPAAPRPARRSTRR